MGVLVKEGETSVRVVVQRAIGAMVSVNHEMVAQFDGLGIVLLVGVTASDTAKDLEYMVDKVLHLRIFPDSEGKMNQDVLQAQGDILSISQFTLYGDVRKGRRPNYMRAAGPDMAEPMYDEFNERLRALCPRVHTGRFGAMMQVKFTNDGPVTILLDSERTF